MTVTDRSSGDTEQEGVGLGETIDQVVSESKPCYVVDRGGPTLHFVESVDGEKMTAYCGDERHCLGPRMGPIFGHPSEAEPTNYERVCGGCSLQTDTEHVCMECGRALEPEQHEDKLCKTHAEEYKRDARRERR